MACLLVPHHTQAPTYPQHHSGGSSLFGSLRERLEKELLELGPQTAKFKITAPMNNQERRFSTWIGEFCVVSHALNHVNGSLKP